MQFYYVLFDLLPLSTGCYSLPQKNLPPNLSIRIADSTPPASNVPTDPSNLPPSLFPSGIPPCNGTTPPSETSASLLSTRRIIVNGNMTSSTCYISIPIDAVVTSPYMWTLPGRENRNQPFGTHGKRDSQVGGEKETNATVGNRKSTISDQAIHHGAGGERNRTQKDGMMMRGYCHDEMVSRVGADEAACEEVLEVLGEMGKKGGRGVRSGGGGVSSAADERFSIGSGRVWVVGGVAIVGGMGMGF